MNAFPPPFDSLKWSFLRNDLLIQNFPEAEARVRLLAGDGADVIDPIGAGMDEYRRCADQIEQYLQGLVAELPAA